VNSTAEHLRLAESRSNKAPWTLWGPYLSEREWGTVREDLSADGNPWASFTHQQAGARAYRWGEDGIAGISDDHQYLCFALALWNGEDTVLKERLFGLANDQGNHGEDVKEYYFYLDNTPTHSYMKYLYKYPQKKFPYEELVHANRARSRGDTEHELLDTGVLAGNRYFDVFVEYAKAAPKDILISITACNRSAQAATLHLLPTLWFRNTWAAESGFKPILFAGPNPQLQSIIARHRDLGEYSLYCAGAPELLFTENETNQAAVYGRRWFGFAKDGIDECVVRGHKTATNPKLIGTKAAAHYLLKVPSRGEAVIRLRLRAALFRDKDPFRHFDRLFAARRREADEFYDTVIPSPLSKDEANVMRQALSGMLWNKQFYNFDLERWIAEHESPAGMRNQDWSHMVNSDVISMPDKWEYPWYAAWDLAFHTIPLALVDLDFAKKQLALMLSGPYLHPSGQMPAHEWNFSQINPPVHAWALLQLAALERELRGAADLNFLKLAFNKLLLNFTWWTNRKDDAGKNALAGGFLGLDNLGVFDCHAALPSGGNVREADGAAWMAFFCQNMLQIALALAWHDDTYAEMAAQFIDHFLWIAASMHREGGRNGAMWNEEDGFFYDAVRLPNGDACLLRLRSMAGLMPLCATTVLDEPTLKRFPEIRARMRTFIQRHPGLLASIALPDKPGANNRRLLALVNENRLRRVLAHMLSEDEFLGPYGIRSLSRSYATNPYILSVEGNQIPIQYLPAESDSNIFGGNANWRGPIWFPFNFLLVHSLRQFHSYYGDSFKVEFPTGRGRLMDLSQIAREIAGRLCAIFLKDPKGRRPVYGGTEIFAADPYWRDLILFYEYFHGDNGAGIGASHQTGWTGLVARLLHLKSKVEASSATPGRIAEAFPRARAS
jgi:hypothetical protein